MLLAILRLGSWSGGDHLIWESAAWLVNDGDCVAILERDFVRDFFNSFTSKMLSNNTAPHLFDSL